MRFWVRRIRRQFVFPEDQARNLLQLGEILPSIFLHVDQLRGSRGIFTLTEVSWSKSSRPYLLPSRMTLPKFQTRTSATISKKKYWSGQYLSPRRTALLTRN